MNKRLEKAAAKQEEAGEARLAAKSAKAFGFKIKTADAARSKEGRGSDEPAYMVLKYYDSGFECFSAWQTEELGQFSDFLKKLGQQSWNTIYTNDGMRPKTLNIETIAESAKPCLKRVREKLSEDIGFIEMRVTKRIRVHGFRAEDAFFLVILDREHRVCPE